MIISFLNMVVPSQAEVTIALGGLLVLLVVMQLVSYNALFFRLAYQRMNVFIFPLMAYFIVVVLLLVVKSII